jgi:Flp pilus assembly protein TadD
VTCPIIIRLLVVPFFLVFLGTSVCLAQDDVTNLLRDSSAAAKQSNYSAAVSDIQAALVLQPKNSEVWYQLGLLQGQLGDFPGAEESFRQALTFRPEFPEAHYSLGVTLIANPQAKLDWPDAIAQFREALNARPDYAEAHNLLGAGLTAAGDIDRAIPELQRALYLRPSFPEAHFNLAIALEKKGEFEKAATEYQSAISDKGSYPEASAALGKLLLQLGNLIQAEQVLITAVSLNPDLADAHYLLARVFQASGKGPQAGVEFSISQSLSQRLPDAMQSSLLSNQALEVAARGDFKSAADLLHKAIALKPDYGVPHYNLGLILADREDFQGASEELEKAISLLPGQAKAWYQLGRVLNRLGDKRNAFLTLSWATKLSPGDPSIRSELISLQDANRSSKSPLDFIVPLAAPNFGAASDSPSDHLAFANRLKSKGDLTGSEGELLRALALRPADLDTRTTLAKIYSDTNDNARAIIEYQKILRIAPNQLEPRIALGEIFLAEGEPQAALDELLVAQKQAPDSIPVQKALDQARRAISIH